MTRPPDYPDRPEFGDDAYGRYGEPASRRGHREPPPRRGYDTAAAGYPEPLHPGYGQPPDSPPPGPARGGRPYDADATAQIPMPRYEGSPSYHVPTLEPGTRPAPDLAKPGPRGRPPGRSKMGLLLGVAGGVLALMLVGGAAVVLLKDFAKPGAGADSGSGSVHPDFADPGKVVDSWLNAMFILKSPEKMLRYTCEREADRNEVKDAIETVEKAENDAKDAELSMKVSWSKPEAATTTDTTAMVTSTLKVVVGEKTKNTLARFDLVNEAGWKVCDTEMK